MTDQITMTEIRATDHDIAAATACAVPSPAKTPAHLEVDDLTTQERRIARRLLHGDGPKQIALVLEISTRTIYWHVENVYAKTGAHSLGEFFAWAYRHRDCCGFAALFERSPR